MNALRITPVARYEVDGRLFLTKEKAIDHIQGLLCDQVKAYIMSRDGKFGMSEAIPLTEFLWANRELIASYLAADIEIEEE